MRTHSKTGFIQLNTSIFRKTFAKRNKNYLINGSVGPFLEIKGNYFLFREKKERTFAGDSGKRDLQKFHLEKANWNSEINCNFFLFPEPPARPGAEGVPKRIKNYLRV